MEKSTPKQTPDPLHSPPEGYVDLQVNGFAGVDFNGDGLTGEALHEACLRLRDDGAAGFLPTVITADLGAMAGRLARLAELRQADPLAREMILGLHIEGPFISDVPGYVGAHPVADVRSANLDELRRLLDAADGLTRIVTLAPERDPDLRMTRFLVDQGITVAAGHGDPSLEELRAAIDAGLSMFTHLGNGCPQQLPRHDNILQRALSLSDKLWISFIVDGAHVPFFALSNYLRAATLDRCVIVSDAISVTGLGPGRHPLGDQTVYVGEDGVPRADEGDHLVGSATSVSRMADNLRRHLRLSEKAIEQLTSSGPRAILPGNRGKSTHDHFGLLGSDRLLRADGVDWLRLHEAGKGCRTTISLVDAALIPWWTQLWKTAANLCRSRISNVANR